MTDSHGRKETKIKWKLQEYLAKLEVIAQPEEGPVDSEMDLTDNDDRTDDDDSINTEQEPTDITEDLPSLLHKIYLETWLGKGGDICVGDFINQKDIPQLVKALFNNLLGNWVDKRIVCVGDYAKTAPPAYKPKSKSLYNSGYRELLSLTNCAMVFLDDLKNHCQHKAETFQKEYCRRFEMYFFEPAIRLA